MTVAKAQCFARDLANTRGGVATPQYLEDRAAEVRSPLLLPLLLPLPLLLLLPPLLLPPLPSLPSRRQRWRRRLLLGWPWEVAAPLPAGVARD